MAQLYHMDYTTEEYDLSEMRTWFVSAPQLKSAGILLLEMKDLQATSRFPINTGLYELDGFGPWVRDRTLSVWLGTAPFCYELFVYIPKRGCTLFSTVDYLAAVRRMEVDFAGIHISRYDTEDIARTLSAHHTDAWQARFKPAFNADLTQRMPLPFSWLPRFSVSEFTAMVSSPLVLEAMRALRTEPAYTIHQSVGLLVSDTTGNGYEVVHLNLQVGIDAVVTSVFPAAL
jgi:hypothetical protein